MKAYADSSFITALYLPEQNSPVAVAFLKEHDSPLPFTPWHRLEVRNALRLAVFRKAIDPRQARIQLNQLEVDLRQSVLIVHTPIDWVAVLREAEKLGAAHNQSIGARSSDLFHVAAAIQWRAERFLTFDGRQKRLAQAAKLAVQ